ncbi:16S rRNA (cytosine(967)-C(5))-methyltransferase RsmB [Limibacillus sp. MBR-115]|uniref:16S rRNA (cytosine(967)-C(5))-methyltransferase RsmB n=1 Tax=Limibacillus sp. MBR-115 TaxID=3156465 RepID=UPI00339435AF
MAKANSRALALRLLIDCLERGQPLDRLLAGNVALGQLETRDRGFVRQMVATTLRRLGQIDNALGACLDKPLKPRQADLRALLRLGAAQILFMAVPAHAAVSETVALADGKLSPFRGLANAVLRRLEREKERLLADQDAARLNLPSWLWSSWASAYGEAMTRNIMAVQMEDPPLDISVKEDPEAWANRLGATILPGGSLRLTGGSGEISALPGFAEGAWWIQDAAAALPARLLGDLSGQRVFDLCAAPGGKTAQLILAGAVVTALDQDAKRLAVLRENLGRLSLTATVVQADASAWTPVEQADAILLDAPCSATGTLRRHPDIAWLRRPSDIAKIVTLQQKLLVRAAKLLAPGGTLVYAVCSLQPEEGPQLVDSFLAERSDFARKSIQPEELPGLENLITAAGDLQSLPGHLQELGGLDGFYACRLVNRG